MKDATPALSCPPHQRGATRYPTAPATRALQAPTEALARSAPPASTCVSKCCEPASSDYSCVVQYYDEYTSEYPLSGDYSIKTTIAKVAKADITCCCSMASQ